MKQTQELKQNEVKTITIRIPQDLWRSLHMAKIDGDIDSVNAAFIRGGYMVLDKINNR